MRARRRYRPGSIGGVPGVHLGDAVRSYRARSVSGVSHLPPRVVCVVVTHRRPSTLGRCLDALSRQSRPPDHLVLVDSAADDESRDALSRCAIPHTILASRTDRGGAGGFAHGILTARALGADWVWLADDDGLPADDRTLATLLRCAEDQALDVVSPLVLDLADPQRLAFPLRQGLTWARTRAAFGATTFLPGIAQLFNGALLSCGAFDLIGVPDPRSFVRGDEVRGHRLLVRSGLRFGTCVQASYLHPTGVRDSRPILGGRVPVYVPGERGRRDRAFRNLGYLSSQPGMRWRRAPDEARYAWYYLAHQRDVEEWRNWRARSAEGRREFFNA